jgi:hypothetical protein
MRYELATCSEASIGKVAHWMSSLIAAVPFSDLLSLLQTVQDPLLRPCHSAAVYPLRLLHLMRLEGEQLLLFLHRSNYYSLNKSGSSYQQASLLLCIPFLELRIGPPLQLLLRICKLEALLGQGQGWQDSKGHHHSVQACLSLLRIARRSPAIRMLLLSLCSSSIHSVRDKGFFFSQSMVLSFSSFSSFSSLHSPRPLLLMPGYLCSIAIVPCQCSSNLLDSQ